MTPDHYATLGLSRASEDVVIRAAYLALMRRYHPDRNPSAEAAAQARAIAAAYAVLGEPGRRAEYDRMRAEAEWATPVPPRSSELPGGAFAAASMALLVLLVSLVVWSPLPLREQPDAPAAVPSRPAEAKPEEPIAIAAAQPAPSPAAEPAPRLGVSRPLPPRQAVRPMPARAIRSAAAPPPTRLPKTRPVSPPVPVQLAAAPSTSPSSPSSTPRPSFSCQVARTRGEIAVCRNVQLANLDRQQALLYSQSWGRADAAKRAQLLRTRERFVTQRDSCRSDSCTSSAYLERMREVSEIMTGDAKPTR